MKKFFFLLILFICYRSSFGQNWEFINPQQVKYFSENDELDGIYSIRIDSIDSINQVSIYHNMLVRQDSSNDTLECEWGYCRVFLVPGWLGPSISIKKEKKIYKFTNTIGDTLKFDFNLSLNDTSTIYENDSILLKMVYDLKIT